MVSLFYRAQGRENRYREPGSRPRTRVSPRRDQPSSPVRVNDVSGVKELVTFDDQTVRGFGNGNDEIECTR